jgi:hypothetical protein
MLGGIVAAEKVCGKQLQKVFGWFIIVLGVLVGGLTATGLSLSSHDA